MRRGTFEIEAIAGIEFIVLIAAKPNFKFSPNDVKKLFTFMSVRFSAATAGLDAEQMRLHGLVAPGQEFHANALGGFQDTAFARRHETGILFRRVEKGKKIGAVEARDASERGDGSAHLAAFEGAQKAHGNACCSSDLNQGKTAFLT